MSFCFGNPKSDTFIFSHDAHKSIETKFNSSLLLLPFIIATRKQFMFLFRLFGLTISISKIYFFMIWIVNVFVFWYRLSTDAPILRLQKTNAGVLSSNWYLATMFRLKWKIPSIYVNKLYSCKFGKCMVMVACTLGRRRNLIYENVHPCIFIDISLSLHCKKTLITELLLLDNSTIYNIGCFDNLFLKIMTFLFVKNRQI